MGYLEDLCIGCKYNRKELASHWNYKSSDAIKSGVVTPKDSKYIILFVTKEKQKQQVQYNDYIVNGKLYWDGQNKHRSDNRIISSKESSDEIHLFYRDHHREEFEYYGEIFLIRYYKQKNRPSRFSFYILSIESKNYDITNTVRTENSIQKFESTVKENNIQSRVGQDRFRTELIKLWKGCSLTGITFFEILKAAHIKPWRFCNNHERLDKFNGLLLNPNYYYLFLLGLITFDDNGNIKISSKLLSDELTYLGINDKLKLRKIYTENLNYLEYHNKNIFKD